MLYLKLPLLLLHFLIRFYGKEKKKYEMDQEIALKYRFCPYNGRVLSFAYLICSYPEYRNIFYRRTGGLGRIMSVFFPGEKTLYIRTDPAKIGGGILIKHGHSTELNANSIGSNCVIFHNVTIGSNKNNIGPTVGENCFFGTGCTVLGDIHIGNNVKIGAGAIVVTDIPDNCTVVLKGTTIVKKDGKKVEIEL